MALAEAAVQGIELESWAKMIPDLVFKGKTLYNRVKNGAKTYPVANITAAPGNIGATTGLAQRPAFRVPMRVQSGATIVQGTGDGDSLGLGTGSQWISGDISPIFLFAGCQITYLAQKATAGKNRGMVAVRAQELKNSLDSFMRGIEAQFNSDSTGMLDQIPTTATVNNATGGGIAGSATYSSIVGLNNANQFQDQQLVLVFSANTGGTLRGSFRVSYADGVLNTIYSTGPLPAGTTTGDYLMVAGSTGVTGTSVAGILTYQTNSTTGTVLGITKANYPSRLVTPNIDKAGNSVSPDIPYRAQILIDRGLGEDSEEAESLVWYCGPDQQLQITAMYQNVLTQNTIPGGDEAKDMVKKYMTPTFGGRELVIGYNAKPGRIDGLCLASWGIAEMIEPSLYEFGNGVTSMPLPDPTGNGWLSANIFYYNACLNLFNSNMRAGVYVTTLAIPTI
jgi:hypothetical protein